MYISEDYITEWFSKWKKKTEDEVKYGKRSLNYYLKTITKTKTDIGKMIKERDKLKKKVSKLKREKKSIKSTMKSLDLTDDQLSTLKDHLGMLVKGLTKAGKL